MTTLGLNFSQHGQLICEEDERKMKITWGGGRFFPFQIAFPPTMTTTACNLHAHVDCIAAHLLLLSPHSRQNSRAVVYQVWADGWTHPRVTSSASLLAMQPSTTSTHPKRKDGREQMWKFVWKILRHAVAATPTGIVTLRHLGTPLPLSAQWRESLTL